MEGPKQIMERLFDLSPTKRTEEGRSSTKGVVPELTSNFGIPTGDMRYPLQIAGHPVTSDVFMMEKQQSFDRAKIVERAVHACGSGALGYFEVTNDVTHLCKAKFLSQVGKRTPVIGRFSTVTYGREFPDSARNPRGLAFKFYTEEGNYDILCINFPAFFVREPSQGPDVIRSQQRNPENFLINYDAMFDFMGMVPESMLANTYFWSDHGHPYGWRYMDGFPCHTFRWVNAQGDAVYVKYTFKSDQGIKNFTFDEAVLMCGRDPDFAKRDLWAHIHNGGQAAWTCYVQVMPAQDALTYKWDPFDNTKVWPVEDYPLLEFGHLVFDKNPENFHRDIEQVAFSPGRLVPGIEPSPDPLLQFRMFFYNDAQLHRLGVNYHQVPVNCPFMAKNHHPATRDGRQRADLNGGAEPHYYPNSIQNAPKPDPLYNWLPEKITGTLDRKPSSRHAGNLADETLQVTRFYNSMSSTERQHLHKNIAGELLLVTKPEIQINFLALCYAAHPEYAEGIIAEMRQLMQGLTGSTPNAFLSTFIGLSGKKSLLPLPSNTDVKDRALEIASIAGKGAATLEPTERQIASSSGV